MQPGKRLGAGARAEVFEYGDAVIKLYSAGIDRRVADREAAILAHVETLGLPAPAGGAVVEVDGRWGVVMARAVGESFGAQAERDRARVPELLAAMVALHRRIHAAPGGTLPDLKHEARRRHRPRGRPMLGAARMARALELLAALPAGDRLCHGDFHPLNILGPPGHETVVDWPDASCGDPAADVCRTLVLLRPHAPDIADAYVDAYCTAAGIPRDAVMAWLPVVAAGRLSEGVAGEEAAMLMAMADAG